MEGIIGKESESILRFFILLENIQVKMDQLMEGNRPPFNGERFLTDRELSGLLKISRRCLQDYRDQGRLPVSQDWKSTRLNSSHGRESRMPSSA